MLPEIPFTEVKQVARWSNFHGTLSSSIDTYCTPDVLGMAGTDGPRRMQRHGQAIRAVFLHCLACTPAARLRVLGAGWSLSNVGAPREVALDPANLNVVVKVKDAWITADYRAQHPDRALVFAQGGATISYLNRKLGEAGLALQTSGASDGHRIAGCIATGTHGSALGIGAVHDTIRAIHLVTGPDRAVFLQPSAGAACTDDVAGWLARETGIPTTSLRDDGSFHAAQVALGSLGIVHGVVIETVPLYRLRRRKLAVGFRDGALWDAVRTLDTRPLHRDIAARPYHFEVVLHPYPSKSGPAAFAVLMWKESGDGVPFAGPTVGPPELSNDAVNLIGDFSAHLDGPIAHAAVRRIVSKVLERRYAPGDRAPMFPGQVFGWSTTPPGSGASTEIVVDHRDTERAVTAIHRALRLHATRGEHLLGAVALRFVPGSRALLGMNIHEQNCFIELPSVRTPEVGRIYESCFQALAAEGIRYTCHWGQQHAMTRQGLDAYFGPRVAQWLSARAQLLPEVAVRRVCESPLLEQVGLTVSP